MCYFCFLSLSSLGSVKAMMVYEIMIKFVTRTETAIEIISLLLLSSYIFRVTKNESTGRQTISAEYLNNFDNVSAFPGTSRLSGMCA